METSTLDFPPFFGKPYCFNCFAFTHLNILKNAFISFIHFLNSQKPTYADAVQSNPALIYTLENSSPHNEKCIGNALPPTKVPKQKEIQMQFYPTIRKNSGFIGVERKKRAKNKQFFLSCIAESVNKGQIYSYLNTRNVTPNNITTL